MVYYTNKLLQFRSIPTLAVISTDNPNQPCLAATSFVRGVLL